MHTVVIVGNGNTKGLVRNGSVTRFSFPSVTGMLQTTLSAEDMQMMGVQPNQMMVNGETFVYGERVENFTKLSNVAMSEDRLNHSTYKHLYIAALTEAWGPGDKRFTGKDPIITTVPVGWYAAPDARHKFKQFMSGEYHIVKGKHAFTYVIEPDAVKVLVEGYPSLTRAGYEDNGKVRYESLLTESVGVVNIGTYTTELIKIDGQHPAPAKCISLKVGLSIIWEHVQTQAMHHHGLSMTLHEADQAVKNGFYRVGKEEMTDVVKWADDIKAQIGENIRQRIDRADMWNGGRALQWMVSAGGGGPQLYDYVVAPYEDIVQTVTATPRSGQTMIEASAMMEVEGADIFAQIKMS